MWKITSATVLLNPDVLSYERQTYSLLDWVGDIGGLYDGLRLLGSFIIAPFAIYSLQVELVSTIFRQVAQPAQEPTPEQARRDAMEPSWSLPQQLKI